MLRVYPPHDGRLPGAVSNAASRNARRAVGGTEPLMALVRLFLMVIALFAGIALVQQFAG